MQFSKLESHTLSLGGGGSKGTESFRARLSLQTRRGLYMSPSSPSYLGNPVNSVPHRRRQSITGSQGPQIQHRSSTYQQCANHGAALGLIFLICKVGIIISCEVVALKVKEKCR